MQIAILTWSIGLCAIPLGAWAGASLYQANAAEASVTPLVVERANKTDWMPGVVKLRGECLPSISVEVDGKSDAVITVWYRNRHILYRLDPAERTTIVAKHERRHSAPPLSSGQKPASTDPVKDLPDGCEGAFSPYAQPEMANIIGTCVSELGVSSQSQPRLNSVSPLPDTVIEYLRRNRKVFSAVRSALPPFPHRVLMVKTHFTMVGQTWPYSNGDNFELGAIC